MAATINTNIATINAQRNLSYSAQSLNTTMQRLSSGLRVNSAKDDAAGLAIADRMNTQVRGLQVASRNANDGISLAQTAEGALGRIGDMLQRMRELAVQASNATNSAGDRKSLQAEVAQLRAEIDRVAKQTNFNGQKILDGSFAGAVFQVAANSGDNVTVGALADTRTAQIANITYAKTDITFDTKDTVAKRAILNYDKNVPEGALKIRVGTQDVVNLERLEPANSSLERIGQVITAINNKSADTGVTAYMVMKPGTQEYDISIMSSKLDANNRPLPVQFLGFSADITGLAPATKQRVGGTENHFKVIQAIDKVADKTAALAAADGKAIGDAITALAGADPFQNLKKDQSMMAALKPFYLNYPALTGDAAVAPTKDQVATLKSALNDYINQNGLINDVSYNKLISLYEQGNFAQDSYKSIINEMNWGTGDADIKGKLTALDGTKDKVEELIVEVNKKAAALNGALAAPVTDKDTYIKEMAAAGVMTDVTERANAQLAAIQKYGVALQNATPPITGYDFGSATVNTLDEAKVAIAKLESQRSMAGLEINYTNQKLDERGIDDIDVSTQEGAWLALKKVDSALDQVNMARGTLGALQARFETTVNNIDIQVENLAAARGRIIDADFAKETANLSRTQILQQAGTTMVAQANQLPQQVLQLLQK